MKRMICIILMMLAACFSAALNAQEAKPEPKFEKDIQAFEKSDKDNPPAKGGIVFAGSSTFTKWKSMVDDMKPLPVINRGFGGSNMGALLSFTDRVVLPYQPRIVVVYEGDNDLGGKDSKAESVFENYKAFVEKVQKALPEVKIFKVTVKPSIKRWERWDEMKKLNQMVADFSKDKKNLGVIDITSAVLGEDGKPIRDIFEKDDLHLNRKGYEKVTAIIKPVLEKEYGQGK